MRKNGFTLIELLAVITILGLIALVSVPAVIKTLRNNDEKKYQEYENGITQAAELYVESHRDLYPELNNVGGKVDILVSVLIQEQYLRDDIVDPSTGETVSLNSSVKATVGSDKIIVYQFVK